MIQVPLITHNHNSPVVGFVVVWVSTTLSLRHWLSNGSTTETIAENVSTSPPADRLFLLAAAGESVGGVSPPSAGGSEGGVSPPSAGGSEGGVSPPSAGGSEGGVSPPSGATVATPSATAGATPSSGIVSLSPHL